MILPCPQLPQMGCCDVDDDVESAYTLNSFRVTATFPGLSALNITSALEVLGDMMKALARLEPRTFDGHGSSVHAEFTFSGGVLTEIPTAAQSPLADRCYDDNWGFFYTNSGIAVFRTAPASVSPGWTLTARRSIAILSKTEPEPMLNSYVLGLPACVFHLTGPAAASERSCLINRVPVSISSTLPGTELLYRYRVVDLGERIYAESTGGFENSFVLETSPSGFQYGRVYQSIGWRRYLVTGDGTNNPGCCDVSALPP